MPSFSRRSKISETLSRYGAGGVIPILLNAHSRLAKDCPQPPHHQKQQKVSKDPQPSPNIAKQRMLRTG